MRTDKSGALPGGNSIPCGSEDIGTKLLTSNSAISGVLDRGPVLGVEQCLAGDPIRNRLLADGFRAKEVANKDSQLALAVTANLHGALQSEDMVGNVSFLHGTEAYTRILVAVNKEGCFTGNKESCTVIDMSTARSKKQAPPIKKAAKKPVQELGPDGLTLSQRLQRLMADRGIGQSELARMCSHYYAGFVPGIDERFKQQNIFNLLQGQASAEVLPILAAVLDVNCLWLQFGIGKKEYRG